MKIGSKFAASALIALASSVSFGASLGSLPPSASFSNTVTGAFTDTWTFDLGSPSIVATSLTNVGITFGSFSTGGITGLLAYLNGVQLLGPTSVTNSPPVTVTTQVLTGTRSLPAGTFSLVVSGTGVTGGSASYGGNIVALAAPVPEPESYAMLLAGLGVMGAIALRRNKSKTD
jgi:hypothetical protein